MFTDESYLLARIDPQGVYSEKRFPHIYLLEENLLHAISKFMICIVLCCH